MEDLSKEELQELLEEYNTYVMEMYEEDEEPMSIYDYYENEYQKPTPSLKCVSVNDIENGIRVVLIDMEDNILNTYNIQVNVSNYSQEDLFKVCYNISKNINSKYYELNGELTQEDVLEIAREEIVK